MKYIVWLCSFLFSMLLCIAGVGPHTWQYWAAVVLYLVPVGFSFYKDGAK